MCTRCGALTPSPSRSLGAALAAALALGTAGAQPPAPRLGEGEILASVVAVAVRTVAHARTADDGGSERQGSGVIVDPGGYVLTSALLVQEADSIVVTTADARTVQAAVALADAATGVAILRPAAGLGVAPLPTGNGRALGIPAAVSIAAAAKGRRIAVGRVAARGDFAGRREQLIEHALVVTPVLADTAGAALVDGNGRLVGVGSRERAVAHDGDPTGNVFIPVEAFQSALAAVLRGDGDRAPRRPWLGLGLAAPPVPLAIDTIAADSPAARAGVRPGDVVLAVNDDPVATRAELYRRIWRERPGAEIALTVRRDGATQTLRVRTIDRQNYLIHRA